MGYYFSVMMGILLGLIYYGGLWFTTRYVIRNAAIGKNDVMLNSPHAVIFLSLIIRTGLVLGGLYWTMEGQWQKLILALGGFILAKIFIKEWVMKGGKSIGNQS